MPTMLPAGTAGWFGRNTPGNDDATPISIDFLNHVRGELKNIVEAFGYAEDKLLVNQIATALTQYVLNAGRYATNVYVGDKTASPGTYGTMIDLEPGLGSTEFGRVRTQKVYSTLGFYIGKDLITCHQVIDNDLDAFLRHVLATGNLEVRGKVKNADGADVVFDDGVTVEGKTTASGGLATVAPAAVAASWDSDADAFTGTLNAVGGAINVIADVTNPIPGNSFEDVLITNSKVATTSRIHATMTYQSGEEPVIITEVESLAGSVRVRLRKLGTGDVTGAVGFHFDVINPA